MRHLEDLPPPVDLDVGLAALMGELVAHIGVRAAVDACLDLLAGRGDVDRAPYEPVLVYLTGRLTHHPQLYWTRSWGARGLLYVWEERAVADVVRGLGDEHWRPAETCLKVARVRGLGQAGPGAERLLDHLLPRVRAQAARTLGVVGDTEHVAAVRGALDDVDPGVRRAASLAVDRLVARLGTSSTRTGETRSGALWMTW